MPSALVAALLLAGCDRVTTVETRQAPKPVASENLLETVSSADESGARPTPSPSASNPRMQALGTEPFWAVDISPGQLRYSTPENQTGTPIASTATTDGRRVIHTGQMDGKPVSLTIEPGTCSDGMSDTVYQWKATLTIDGRTEQGCARIR